MRTLRPAILLGTTMALGACATGPTPVVGMPGPNKDFATFQKEDTACRQEAGTAARPGAAGTTNTNAQWQVFFQRYAQCATAHGDTVQPAPWSAAYADYLGYNTMPYGAYGYGAPYGWGYPYAYAGYPGFYGDPFLFGYPYPFFGAGYGLYGGFGYGGFGYGHFGGGRFAGGFGFSHGGGGRR